MESGVGCRRGRRFHVCSGTLEYHYWDDVSVKDLIRRLMLLKKAQNEDGKRVLSGDDEGFVPDDDEGGT